MARQQSIPSDRSSRPRVSAPAVQEEREGTPPDSEFLIKAQYRCPVCNQGYYVPQDVRRHLELHTDIGFAVGDKVVHRKMKLVGVAAVIDPDHKMFFLRVGRGQQGSLRRFCIFDPESRKQLWEKADAAASRASVA
ncbi:hypothetical protein EPN90_03375 [Patescibacteria group bacterium]|nr:MAG: hypothetical protein EPN90_03375 [Patescibacteria group bacterium]